MAGLTDDHTASLARAEAAMHAGRTHEAEGICRYVPLAAARCAGVVIAEVAAALAGIVSI